MAAVLQLVFAVRCFGYCCVGCSVRCLGHSPARRYLVAPAVREWIFSSAICHLPSEVDELWHSMQRADSSEVPSLMLIKESPCNFLTVSFLIATAISILLSSMLI